MLMLLMGLMLITAALIFNRYLNPVPTGMGEMDLRNDKNRLYIRGC